MEPEQAATMTALREEFKTAQQKGFDELTKTLVERVNKVGNDLDGKFAAGLKEEAARVAKLSDDFADVKAKFAERFQALAAEDYSGRGPRGEARRKAQALGLLAMSLYQQGRDQSVAQAARNELAKMAILPTGTGGDLVITGLLADIVREADLTGIFGQDLPPKPVYEMKAEGPRGTGGVTIYFPAFGTAASYSTPTFGKRGYDLKRIVAGVQVDNWMLKSRLAVVLGEYLRQELAYGVALAKDTNWFVGDGTGGYNGYKGLFKLTGQAPGAAASGDGVIQVTGDSGDDTFDEMIAKTTYYLSRVLGALPSQLLAAGPRWYLHPLTFFKYFGVRDSGGMPIVSVFIGEGPQMRLFGLPARLVPTAPSTTAVSTCFAILTVLGRACEHYQHAEAIEFEYNPNIDWLGGVGGFKIDVPADRVIRYPAGVVQLVTHS